MNEQVTINVAPDKIGVFMATFEPDGKNAIHDGIEHEPGGGKGLLDPTDTVLLLLIGTDLSLFS